jgi:hypothetical protein
MCLGDVVFDTNILSGVNTQVKYMKKILDEAYPTPTRYEGNCVCCVKYRLFKSKFCTGCALMFKKELLKSALPSFPINTQYPRLVACNMRCKKRKDKIFKQSSA